MIKLSKKTYRCIEYINLSSLSSDQQKSLKQSLSNRTLIKILQGDIVINDCVLYAAYENWYNSIVAKDGNKVILVEKEEEAGGWIRKIHKQIPTKSPWEKPQDTVLERAVTELSNYQNLHLGLVNPGGKADSFSV